jgi:hypothetical protein
MSVALTREQGELPGQELSTVWSLRGAPQGLDVAA